MCPLLFFAFLQGLPGKDGPQGHQGPTGILVSGSVLLSGLEWAAVEVAGFDPRLLLARDQTLITLNALYQRLLPCVADTTPGV